MINARLLMLVALAAGLAGCVERKMMITSQPEGAVVIISDREVGRTPVTVPFTWYGDYDIILRMQGYETLKTHAKIYPPVYEIPPLDLLSYMAPWTYRDNRYLDYTLQKQEQVSGDELIRRADQLKARVAEPVKK